MADRDATPRDVPAATEPEHEIVPPTSWALAREFLRISLVGFGGPNAHLALMLDSIVDRKRWIDREHFLHLVAITNLLPGPNSSEVAIHIGYTQRGWRGALITGSAFIGPTLLMMVALSALYFRYGSLPEVQPLFWALKPVIVAVILGAGWKLGRTAVTDWRLLLLAATGAAVAVGPGRLQLAAMLVGAVLGWALYGRGGEAGGDENGGAGGGGGSSGNPAPPPGRRLLAVGVLPALSLLAAGSLGHLFLVMLGIGATLFGGGYVLVVLLQSYAVERFAWISAAQFLDGVAISQALPGPISTLAAFVGFGAGGVPGAVLATLGVYLPALAAVLLVAPHLERWRQQHAIRGALRGVNAVVAGAVAGTAVALAPSALPDPVAGVLLVAAGIAVARGVSPPWLIMAGLTVGVAALAVGG